MKLISIEIRIIKNLYFFFLKVLMYYLTLPTINEAFVPPKPKEFDKAIFTFFSLAFKGTKSIPSALSQGFSKFNVGGIISLLTASIEKIASTAPAAPNMCPTEDLVELTDKLEILS